MRPGPCDARHTAERIDPTDGHADSMTLVWVAPLTLRAIGACPQSLHQTADALLHAEQRLAVDLVSDHGVETRVPGNHIGVPPVLLHSAGLRETSRAVNVHEGVHRVQYQCSGITCPRTDLGPRLIASLLTTRCDRVSSSAASYTCDLCGPSFTGLRHLDLHGH